MYVYMYVGRYVCIVFVHKLEILSSAIVAHSSLILPPSNFSKCWRYLSIISRWVLMSASKSPFQEDVPPECFSQQRARRDRALLLDGLDKEAGCLSHWVSPKIRFQNMLEIGACLFLECHWIHGVLPIDHHSNCPHFPYATPPLNGSKSSEFLTKRQRPSTSAFKMSMGGTSSLGFNFLHAGNHEDCAADKGPPFRSETWWHNPKTLLLWWLRLAKKCWAKSTIALTASFKACWSRSGSRACKGIFKKWIENEHMKVWACAFQTMEQSGWRRPTDRKLVT